MSHQVQLSPAASHCPIAVLDPAGHAARPPTCRSRCPPLPPAAHAPDSVPPWKIRSARPSFTPRPKIGRARDQYGRTGPRGPATVPPLSAGRPDSREEGSGARTPRATGAPHYMTSHPASDLPASKAHNRDRPVRYPGATGHRPPVDPRRPPGAGQPQRPRRRIRLAEMSAVLPSEKQLSLLSLWGPPGSDVIPASAALRVSLPSP
jgi:hypothetical protein